MKNYFLLLALLSSNALAGPPAYTRWSYIAGDHFGHEAAHRQRDSYLDNNEGAYCTMDMRKLVSAQLAKLVVTPPAKKEWQTGTEYGNYLQSYFAGACGAYANEISFSGIGEPCGNYRHYYSDYKDGIDQGEEAFAADEAGPFAKLPRDYCTGGANAAEQARSAFLEALKTEVTDKKFYKRSEARAYIRGFVLGVCAEFAKVSCAKHLERPHRTARTAVEDLSRQTYKLAVPSKGDEAGPRGTEHHLQAK